MTLFAGAYCLDPRGDIPRLLKESLRLNLRSVSDSRGSLHLYDQQRMFLVKWDSGAFKESAWEVAEDGSLSTLVGDPLLTNSGIRLSRKMQLSKLIHLNGGFCNAVLKQTRGSFSAVRYETKTQILSISTDMIGLRPVYYTMQDGILIFASALRVLESMSCVRKKLSIPGMVELGVFGFPLAERTPYEAISVLRESEILNTTAAGIELSAYHDWTVSAAVSNSPIAAANALFAEFQESIRIRVNSDRRVYAFLSGGMDSRAIVSSLMQLGCTVEALNFSPDASQDQAYARSFAEVTGSSCHLNCFPRDDDPNFSLLALKAKTILEQAKCVVVDRTACVWSGDGGSVGLGHVYMDEVMLDYADRGDLNAALGQFFIYNRLTLPLKVLSTGARQALPKMITTNVLSELNRYPRADLGRRIYLFLLFNDQRRHLFKHFESIDQHGLEFLLPFYDAQFLKMVADTPSRWGVFHNLYARWFDHLPVDARSTPWQTYPGHQPCPITGDSSLSYQWSSRSQPAKAGFKSRLHLSSELLKESCRTSLPEIFSRSRIGLAAFLNVTGLRDCSHIFKMLLKFRHHGENVD